ncbi:MAG: hypothetical protein HY071_01715, partial [Chloroflexi bacterium]|nr:hypothetical protein [Chloroflexota bacterium]
VGLDVVWLEPVPLSRASWLALRRPFAPRVPVTRRARERCRALLHGHERLFLWDRRVWLDRGAYRDRDVRAILRPIVFDTAAVEHARPSGTVARSSGALARWMSG